MQITETKVKLSDFCKTYSDNADGGVTGVPITFLDIYNPE